MVKQFQEAARVKVYGDDLAEIRKVKAGEATIGEEEVNFFATSAIYRDKMCLDEARWAFDAMALPTTKDVEVAAEEGGDEPAPAPEPEP